MSAIKGTMEFYRPYALSLIGVLVTIFLALSFDLFIPQALKFLIDNVLGHRMPFSIPGLIARARPSSRHRDVLAVRAARRDDLHVHRQRWRG